MEPSDLRAPSPCSRTSFNSERSQVVPSQPPKRTCLAPSRGSAFRGQIFSIKAASAFDKPAQGFRFCHGTLCARTSPEPDFPNISLRSKLRATVCRPSCPGSRRCPPRQGRSCRRASGDRKTRFMPRLLSSPKLMKISQLILPVHGCNERCECRAHCR